MPASWSCRIAAYSSAFDICDMNRAFHQDYRDAPVAPAPVIAELGFWLRFVALSRCVIHRREQIQSDGARVARMITSGMGLVAQWLSRLHRMWEDAGSNPAGPIPPRPYLVHANRTRFRRSWKSAGRTSGVCAF